MVLSLLDRNWFKALVALILLLIAIFLLHQVSFIFTPIVVLLKTIFLPFILAGILFYLCRPLVRFLEKQKVPKGIAIIVAYIAIILAFYGIFKLIGPVVNDQIDRFVKNFPKMQEAVEESVTYVQDNWEYLPESVRDMVSFDKAAERAQSFFTGFASDFVSILTNIFSTVFVLVLVPFILFYMLKDGNRLGNFIALFFPAHKREDVKGVLGAMDKTISSYIQGQVLVSVCVGTLLLIGYLIIGLDYSLVLALFGMLTNVIPFIGPFIAVVPALLVALFQDPIMVVYVAIIMIIAQQIEGNIISPQVMGKTLDIHPLTIIVLILFAGNLVGFLGIIFVIPTYAVVKTVIIHLYKLTQVTRDDK
ncbi:hypothetical protein Q73_12340 [Bacillus coahuilensis m2-6]|uniref:AI-2E family transporter n=1 Tax=Bacillus coahuilensis p1.1.43 TaxID=1150625 RepID=A0A147K5P4_9BACI|nr:AI-2E family transporter [Bacillus coahuilensis]KUP05162.1 hypothetical protein Q75_12940 [Bacillus coahuilensis p1.1.43]KUP05615.1 hypothetical protein Q73_12340 [Bacillus coahuilensis m2-6]